MKSNSFTPKAIAISLRIYTRMLLAYPKAHRQEYGPLMTQHFHDLCRDAWKAGRGAGLASLWLRTIPDLVKTSVLEHLTTWKGQKNMTAPVTSRRSPERVCFMTASIAFAVLYSAIIVTTWLTPEKYGSFVRLYCRQPGREMEFVRLAKSPAVLDSVVTSLKLTEVFARQLGADELTVPEARELVSYRMKIQARNLPYLEVWCYDADKTEAAAIANKLAEVSASMMELRIVDSAKPGLKPALPNYPRNILGGGIAGLIVAILIGLFAGSVTALCQPSRPKTCGL